nr:MAG TPA: hypothetical protein [Caudoviricetes sp.]
MGVFLGLDPRGIKAVASKPPAKKRKEVYYKWKSLLI